MRTTPFRHSENEGNALFSNILHHKYDYIKHKMQDVLLNFDQEFILIIASCKRRILIQLQAVQHIKYEMDLLSFTAKRFGAGCSILMFKELSLLATLSLSSQSTESFARKFCKRNFCEVYRFFKSSFDEIFPE